MAITYITYETLARDVREFSARVPPDVACIAGIPRSGMIPAAMLGLHLHLPVVDIYSLCAGQQPKSSGRLDSESRFSLSSGGGHHVLVVDDSIYCGSSLRAAKAAVASRTIGRNLKFTYAAIYRHGGRELHPQLDCDLYHRNVPPRRYFEWNLMQHPDLANVMLDIDGVLCRDPTVYDDDGPEYVAALEKAIPLHIPKLPVGHLITCRINRWRPQTEAWLQRHDIAYKSLTMADYPTAAERRRECKYGEWKGEHYAKSGATLFVESDKLQAPDIASVAGKPVICLEDGSVYQQ